MPLKIIRDDITRVNTEAVVNTANRWCEVGAGCDTAIYNAAGYDELLSYRKEHIGEKDEGEAFLTPGFKLPAKYIIHVVSPLFIDGTEGEEDRLRACYRNALSIADEKGLRSISFPLIAAGSFGYPKADALRIALDETNAFLLTHEMDVTIVVFDSEVTYMAQKLYPQLEAFIDQNYVCDKKEEEYKNLYFGADRGYGGRPKSGKAMLKRPAGLSFPNLQQASGRASELPPLENSKVNEVFKAADECAEVSESAELFEDYDGDFDDELEDSPALHERLSHLQDTFGEYLFYMIETKGYSSTEVQNRAWITKGVYSKIKTAKKTYQPSKRVALQLCIGLKLSIDEAIDILGRAGYAFSPCDKQDLIFRFFIENKCYDILGVSDALEKYGVSPIVGF